MPVALIVGGSADVWWDVTEAHKFFVPDAYFVLNDFIPIWPLRLDYAVTLHAEKLPGWLKARCGPKPGQVWSFQPHDLVTHVTRDWAGSSGLFAVKVALEQGFDGIVLAGVPMTTKAGHFVRREIWPSAKNYQNGWNRHLKEITPFVRSMSGWTQEILGAPTREWLKSRGASPADQSLIGRLSSAQKTWRHGNAIENSTGKP